MSDMREQNKFTYDDEMSAYILSAMFQKSSYDITQKR